jgi:hypothetical protein
MTAKSFCAGLSLLEAICAGGRSGDQVRPAGAAAGGRLIHAAQVVMLDCVGSTDT